MISGLKPYPAMKDSGVPWLGQVPEHWEVTKLRQCASIEGGMTPSMETPRYWGGAIPWVTPKDMKQSSLGDSSVRVTPDAIRETSLHLIPAPAVLMVVRGMILARRVPVARTTAPITVNQDMKALLPKRGVTADFLAAFLSAAKDGFVPMIDEAGHGTRRLPTERWRDLPVALPSEQEQVAITRFLDHADRRIRRYIIAKQKLIKLLEEQKQAIIHQAITRGLAPGLRLKESGYDWMGQVPAHWEILKLKQLSHRISGRLVYQPAKYFSVEGVPFLMANNVTPDGIRWTGVKRIPEDVNTRFAECALREGDVVTVRVGAPGVTCAVPREADGINCGSLMIIRRSDRFNSSWLTCVMNGILLRHQIAQVEYGAAQKQFNITDAVNFVVPTPPRPEQDAIAAWVAQQAAPISAAVGATRRQIDAVRGFRTRLIADVVTGKLDVREAAARLLEEIEDSEPLGELEAGSEVSEAGDDEEVPDEAEV